MHKECKTEAESAEAVDYLTYWIYTYTRLPSGNNLLDNNHFAYDSNKVVLGHTYY